MLFECVWNLRNSDIYHYGGSWEDQGILTLKHLKRHFRSISQTTTGITTEPSHRFTGAHHSVMLRLFWLGLTSPLNTSKTAYKRLFMIIARVYPNILTISVLWLLIPLSALFRYPSNRLNQFCAGVTAPSTHKKDGNRLLEHIKNERGIYFKYRAVIIIKQHDSLSWILCRSQNHITFVINCFSN